MDTKSAIIAICFFVTNVQALQELTGERIFSISGINKFRRHSHLDIDCTDPKKITEDKSELLKKYLTLKSRQQSEIVDLVAKQSHGEPLPLQTSYLEIRKVLYEAKNMHYDGLNYAIKSKTVCLPWSGRNLKNPINLPQDEDYPGDPRYKSDCNGTRLEQHIELADIKIEGLLTNETGKSEFFSITFFNPKMEASYLRILTKTQGYVTKSFTEDLTMESIILNITNQGVSELFDMSGNTEILQKVAQVWMTPVVDAIKNQHTYIEVLQQSEALSSTYVGEVFQRLVDQVEFIITKGYLSVRYPEYLQTYYSFLGRLHVAHYESLIDLNDTSCGQQIFTHSFHIKFKRHELLAAEEEGDEAIHRVAKELSLKFEIDTNKFGEPLTKTKKYEVDLKLDIISEPRGEDTILMFQKVISLWLTESLQERINDLFF